MATKSDNEKQSEALVARTDTKMAMQLVSIDADSIIPESLSGMLGEGFETQRHIKLNPGKMVKGIYKGMEDGELSARSQTGEIPKVKWVYLTVAPGMTIRLLGAYNMVSQLQRVPLESEVLIARGEDYQLPNNFRCSDYFVFHKPPRNVDGAKSAVVETKATPA